MARFLVALCLILLLLTQRLIGGEVIAPSGATWTDPNYSIEMVRISSGTFTMGSPDTDGSAFHPDEKPQHQVTITKDFYLGKFEVTQGQWEAVMDSDNSWPRKTPSSTFGLSTSHPAYYISWNDINAVGGFLDKINEASGCDISTLPTDGTRYHPANVPSGCYRLPTEAEWEYSARAGTTTRFSYGDDEGWTQLTQYGWYQDNSSRLGSFHPDYGTHPGGQKLANPWGLYDMYGNVCEWTYDRYASSHPTASQNDPSGPIRGNSRVFRGGSWRSGYGDLRSADRNASLTVFSTNYNGFRLLLVK